MKVKYHSLTYASFLRILPRASAASTSAASSAASTALAVSVSFPSASHRTRIPSNAHATDPSDVWRLSPFSSASPSRGSPTRPTALGYRCEKCVRMVAPRARRRDAQRLGDGGVAFALGVLPQVVRERRLVHEHLHAARRGASHRERQSPL